jgi:hypothetical protein
MTHPMIHLAKTALVLGIGLTMLPGCPLLTIEAEVEEVCLSYPNLEVTSAMAQSSIRQSFVFDDLSAIHDLAEHDAHLEFVRATVRATSGIADFQFIRAVRIVVSSGDPGSALPPLTMYDCDGDCAPEGNELAIPAATGNDAIAYLRGDSVLVDLDFDGEIPAGTWTMDVDVCMKGKAAYTVNP